MTDEEREREAARQDMEMYREDAVERLKAQIDLGKLLIQSLILVNGGAIIALFTLLGAQGDRLSIDANLLWRAFCWFIAGLVAALIAGLGGFMSQYCFHQASCTQTWREQGKLLRIPYDVDFMPMFRWGNRVLLTAIAVAVLSLICFGVGAASALAGTIGT